MKATHSCRAAPAVPKHIPRVSANRRRTLFPALEQAGHDENGSAQPHELQNSRLRDIGNGEHGECRRRHSQQSEPSKDSFHAVSLVRRLSDHVLPAKQEIGQTDKQLF